MARTELTLLYRIDRGKWQQFLLEQGSILIGRDEDCDLVLPDESVSRKHLKLRRYKNHVFVMDVGSMNGTLLDESHIWVNCIREFQPGQILQLGKAALKLKETSITDKEPEPRVKRKAQRPWSGRNLQYRRSGETWQQFSLPEGEIIIGRHADADLYLHHEKVSRRHASLQVSHHIQVKDLGSTNGTILNGRLMMPRRIYPIRTGDLFSIGDHEFKLPGDEKIHSGSSTMFTDFAEHLASYEQHLDQQRLTFNFQQRFSIGRASDNDITINHPLVSRYHAVVEKMGARFRLRDLESMNGVFVNAKRIKKEAWLKDGDLFSIGTTEFLLAGSNLQRRVDNGLRLDACNLNQFVSKKQNLLRNIDLKIRPMEFVALVGMSGAGKSTLLNALSGFWPASHGNVVVNGLNLYNHYDLFRNDIGYVPQQDVVHNALTPFAALDYTARLRLPPDITTKERKNIVKTVLMDLDLWERAHLPISKLSGGQLKRVSIGVELLSKPRLFFLDEPTSGLDPGTEYEMMKLMRKLADQGRTVVLVTHATKNVMLCDKVIFLARGGFLAYFGPPEKALDYFNQFRTPKEQREKEMEFDDIYILLNDPARGQPEDWGKRFLQSGAREPDSPGISSPSVPGKRPALRRQPTVGIRQFFILSARNLKILTQDRVSLVLMIALAPIIGMLDFIWGRDLFDPVTGDSTKTITMWFMASIITFLVGVISSVREIVKENNIYKRERAVNLKVLPYIFSKAWIGVVLALYQAAFLFIFKLIFVNPNVSSLLGYPALYITLFICVLCGYFTGLAISSGAPNQNSAMILIIAVFVPQLLFSGGLVQLDLIPGGEFISTFVPTRWTFESFVYISGIGDRIREDLCWSMEKTGRSNLDDKLKMSCPCMGESIFTDCADFPGILSKDIYDENARLALMAEEPEEPVFPTAYPTFTPLPTPTRYPKPTALPTPLDPLEMGRYIDDQETQLTTYQEEVIAQMDDYLEEGKEQGKAYADLSDEQIDTYKADMDVYGEERADWQKEREKTIRSAEAMLEKINELYGRGFEGSIFGRWFVMSGHLVALILLMLIFQKRKDIV